MKYVKHKKELGEHFIQHTFYFAIEENKISILYHALKS